MLQPSIVQMSAGIGGSSEGEALGGAMLVG